MTSNAEKIKEKLAGLNPSHIAIVDETERHHGHAGYTGGEMTHLKLKIISTAFTGKSRLARQRMVMDLLAPLFHETNLHALSLEAKAPTE